MINEWLAARNILAMRMDNIGDVLMLGPALRAIKESSPSALLTLLASPAGATAAPLLPKIEDVITWRAIWQDVGGRMPLDPDNERRLISLLAGRKFDAAIIFTSFSQTPHTPGYVCYLAGIPLRAGESKEFGGSTLTVELRGTPEEAHQVERNLRLVETLGFQARDRHLTVSIPEEARQKVPELLQEADIDPDSPFVLLHPGASAQARRYPARHFGTVARLLSRHGWPVLITGVERAALAICNDTLLMHLADAVRTPEVVLFSGTDREEQWQPRTTVARLLRRPTSCSPCYLFECPIGQPCLDIPPEEVVAAVEDLLPALAVEAVSQGEGVEGGNI